MLVALELDFYLAQSSSDEIIVSYDVKRKGFKYLGAYQKLFKKE